MNDLKEFFSILNPYSFDTKKCCPNLVCWKAVNCVGVFVCGEITMCCGVNSALFWCCFSQDGCDK